MKPAPTGRDGIMRTSAGRGAGFEVRASEIPRRSQLTMAFLDVKLDDEDDELVREFIRLLRVGAETLEAQLEEPDHARFVKNALSEGRRYIKWAHDVEHHQTRRTMPITNTRDVTNVIGYRYTTSPGS